MEFSKQIGQMDKAMVKRAEERLTSIFLDFFLYMNAGLCAAELNRNLPPGSITIMSAVR